MAEYFAFQAALCFSVAHILVRRGLVNSNALTGSFISLATSAAAFWMLLPWFVPLSALWAPAIIYFVVAGFFAPAVGQTLGYLGIERIGVARSAPIVNSAPIFSSLLAVFFLGEVWVFQNIIGTSLVIIGVIILSSIRPYGGAWRKRDVIYPPIATRAVSRSISLRKMPAQTIVSNGLHAIKGSTLTTLPTLRAEKTDRIAPLLTTAAAKNHPPLCRLNLSSRRPPCIWMIASRRKKAVPTVTAAARIGICTAIKPVLRNVVDMPKASAPRIG